MSTPLRCLAPAAIVIALALVAPAAPAMPVIDAQVRDSAPTATLHAAPSRATSSARSTSFDWGSAAIGAGGVVILVALISAGLAAAGRARVTTTR